MTPSFRLLLLTGAVWGAALSACADSSADTPFIPGPTPDLGPCTVDQDCPDAALFICNTALSRCEPACRTREDCGAARRGEYALSFCDTGSLGCQCDMQRCVVAVCATDVECGVDEVCRNGTCVAPPAAVLAASCQVTPDVVVGTEGALVSFGVWVQDAAGRPMVPREGVEWVAVSKSVAGTGSGTRAVFTLEAPGALADAVEVRVGTAVCRARVSVLSPDVPAGGLRVLAVDELTGRPIPAVTVMVSTPQGQGRSVALTGPDGTAWVPAAGEMGVSLFHADYGYLTLARHALRDGRDLRVALRRNPLDSSGGVRAEFAGLGGTGSSLSPTLQLGVTGLSVPGLFSEPSLDTLLGMEREVELNVLGGAQRLSLPSGSSLWLAGATPPAAKSPGVAGTCDRSLAGVVDPEVAILAGQCGTRAAWALTGSLPLAELPLQSLAPGADPLLTLGRVLPVSTRFFSSVARDAAFTLAPTPGLEEGAPDPLAAEYPQHVTHEFEGVRLAFPFAVRVPALPRFQGTFLDRAYVLTTVAVPGRGLVPLGLGAAANVAPADPNTDADARLGRPGVVFVRMAPAHHGLEGQPYRILVSAMSRSARDDSAAPFASSFIVADLSRLDFDPDGARPVEPPIGFLPVPESVAYNFDSKASGDLEGRQFVADVDTPATLLRVVFTNRLGRRWTVLATPDEARDGFRVPTAPEGHEDRTYSGDHLGSRALLRAELLQVTGRDARDALGPSRLASADGPGMEHVGDLTRAASVLDVGRPEVAWLYPELEGQRLSRGSAIRVKVSGFRPGADADGRVRVTLSGATACAGTVLVSEAPVASSSGEVELRLPAHCSGLGVSLVAALEDPRGALLVPPVVAVRAVDIP
ncbi:carboxypeptidase regulatory-like domain-containing protein [Myxococcus sp. K15C18031901]|uniref:dickkopf-related protein n=1 Tax=Myxococcus dinghuensis TaxID=2906761 RepID=UPI0020A6F6C3|nr:dickkopf-related protein [Myxococcus dinghuensis]MCP3100411.1 carboxypeptidase regulatory-like domain-containing protein [Myxococcus dinghuensis]